MISSEQQAKILRLYHAEKWRVGTIARQLGIHHSIVRRVLTQAGVPPEPSVRPRMVDPYLPFIRSVLEKYPTLTAYRIYEMVRARGYPGRPDHFRHIMASLRPRKPAQAYLRLRTLPGEQAQVDWGHFGKIQIGHATRALMAFVMVLSYSRMTFLRFFLDAQMPNFLRGHVSAFAHFGGVARIILYDNLRSAVLERDGDAIRFHPTLLQLAAHYRFEPRPVGKARGNEKGRVERRIRDIRQSFMAARSYTDIEDLNRQALDWCQNIAKDRPCPEDASRKVIEVFGQEKPNLLALPDNPFDTTERVAVSAGKQPYVRFDRNDYSIPHDHVRRTLVVIADLSIVRIVDGTEVIATHKRTFGKGEQVEDASHVDGLRAWKAKAKNNSIVDLLHRAVPSSGKLLQEAAERGASIRRMSSELNALLDTYGPQALEAALAFVLEHNTPHIGAVRQVLEIHRKQRGEPPPVMRLSSQDPRVRDAYIKPHDLGRYDQLGKEQEDDEEQHTD